MVYFDNAATTRGKPSVVTDAFINYVEEIGTSPGRGSYSLGVQASRMLYQSRKTIASFFGCPGKMNVVFTKNSTEAINMFLRGYLSHGDHVLISPFEHNAVLRPIHNMKREGIIDYDVVPVSVLEDTTYLKNYIRNNTKLVVFTLASNLTGEVIYTSEIGKECEKYGIPVFVDASQGGGKGLINMERDHVSYLAFTGHKDLLGLPGVGGLCSTIPLTFSPLIQGGTGIHGEEYINPKIYPDAYEAGTLNMPAIWALKNAVDYVSQNLKDIAVKEKELMDHLVEGLTTVPNIIVFRPNVKRVPTICFNLEGKSSSDVVSYLDQNGICVRGGIHCAILAHETLGTVKTGAVRISLNYHNTHEEIDYFLERIKEVQ